jgi:RNA polymerase sigma-70 factor (ECF subfamily)
MSVPAKVYDDNKRFLWGVCYRMTGNAADAEDLVQETFVRAMEKPPRDTNEPWRPWLLRVAINLSRNQLRRRRQRGYEGQWLPSPVPTDDVEFQMAEEPASLPEDSPLARYDLLESISIAFLLALEALTPSQRAVLLLRDVLDYSTNETASALDMTETGVKVTLHRARRVMREYDKARLSGNPAPGERNGPALERFLEYLQTHNLEGLERLLAQDVVVVTDGGGEVNALRLPMQGRQEVLRLVTLWFEAQRGRASAHACELNGQPGVLVQRSGVKPGQAAWFTLQCEIDRAGLICRLNYVLAPSKLTAVVGRELKVER